MLIVTMTLKISYRTLNINGYLNVGFIIEHERSLVVSFLFIVRWRNGVNINDT